jgi:hypothetical protein
VSQAERRFCAYLALACAALFLLFSEGAISGSDGESMYETTRSMIVDHDFSIRSDLGIPGRDGKTYSRLGVGLPIVSAPAYIAGAGIGAVVGHRDDVEHALVSSTIPITCALLVVALYALARRLGGTPRNAAFVAIGSIVGTFALAYTKEFFSEPLATLGLVLCVERFLARRFPASAAALIVAVVTRPQLVVLVPFLLVAVWRKDRTARTLALVAVPVAVGGMLVAGYNLARFGGIFSFGYQDYGFLLPQLEALRAFLVSPTKSLILFAPVVVLLPLSLVALYKTRPEATWALVVNAVGVLAVTVCVEFWEGGWPWGPRYLYLLLIPACASLVVYVAGSVARQRVVAALFAIGFVVSASTLVVSTRAQQLDSGKPQQPHPTRQVALVPKTLSYTAHHLYDYQSGTGTYYRSSPLWQFGLTRLLGRKGLALGLVGSVALAAVALLAGRRAFDALSGVGEASL